MRLLITNVLAMALLIFGAASASAFSTSMSTAYTAGTILTTGETVTLSVYFDTEGGTDIQVLSVSVLFDDNVMTYDQGSSTAPTYALYVYGGRNNVSLAQLSTNLTLRALTTNQVLLDWSSTAVPAGTRDACGDYGIYPVNGGNGCGFEMAVLQFTVHTAGDDALFQLSNNSPGNTFSLGDGSQAANPVSGDFVVTTPEPTTALLVGLGLAGLGVAGRRRS